MWVYTVVRACVCFYLVPFRYSCFVWVVVVISFLVCSYRCSRFFDLGAYRYHIFVWGSIVIRVFLSELLALIVVLIWVLIVTRGFIWVPFVTRVRIWVAIVICAFIWVPVVVHELCLVPFNPSLCIHPVLGESGNFGTLGVSQSSFLLLAPLMQCIFPP
jgi:hypothetical protein